MSDDRPDTAIVRIEKMVAGGDALAHLDDGRVVFVEGAWPAETVRVRLVRRKRDFARAAVVEVVDGSPARVHPPCSAVARGCGGCGWQHAEPSAQLRWKVDVVAEAMRRTGRLPDADVRAGAAVGPWRYRSGMRLAVAADGSVGLRRSASRDVVPLDECPVAVPELSSLLGTLRVRGADEVALRVSVASGEATAHVPAEVGNGTEQRARIEGLPPTVGIGAGAVLHEVVSGTRLRVSAASFFQSGPAAAELLVEAVRSACGDALGVGTLLDAYGGCGLFAATLSPDDAVVVESSPSACADARANVAGAEVVQAPFESWRPRPLHLAVADPARAGLGRAGSEVLASSGASRVVLVSCDPVSAARDAGLLVALGFRHEGSTVLDLFPHTPHVEVVTRFDR